VKQWQWLIVAATFFIWGNAAKAQERIQFRSLESGATVLDGYLYPSIGAGRHPAVVFLHGCSGMFDRNTGLISRLERDWASVLNGDGYSVLMVDSFRPRSIDQTCAPATYNPAVVAARPKDACGVLYYLQNQSFVRGDRIALIGWSAGGGTVLRTIPQQSGGRPASLPQGDFRAAVALYPALCSDQREAASWTSNIPLLVLFGAADVWTPLVESPRGLSPPGATRSVREPLDSYGSRCSAVSMTELPVGEECWIYAA
jgi:dienelactone hydrolase